MNYSILVNKETKFDKKYLEKINLVNTYNVDNVEILVEENTLMAYKKLESFLEKKNIKIGITSAYRTEEYQESILKEIAKKRGSEYAKDYVAQKGYSEHHTGLALDIGIMINGEFTDEITEEMEKIYNEIHKIIHQFGFILRYPKGKEDITGYSYEPWHIRYVGKTPARIIYEKQLVLEEYLKEFGTVLFINKPKGITSFDVVNEIKHLFGIKKVGHTGTLDPLATGVLLVAVGQATKIVELLTAEDKEYIAEAKLGIKTDTYDISGKVLETKEIPEKRNIKKVLDTFQKTYFQEVPIYSAVKVKGKKLYDYARNHQEVSLPKKEVTIKEIKLLDERKDSFIFRAKVTKGCYIRSLIMDIGMALNTYATMTSLIRTRQGSIELSKTNTLEEIKNNKFSYHDIEEVLDYPKVILENEEEKKVSNGCKIPNKWGIEDKVIFKNKRGKILGIYQREREQLKVWKNFN